MIHQHILVPIDLSKHADLALQEGVDLARIHRSQLTVVYVIPQAIFHPDWATDVEDAIDIEMIAEEARKTLSDMVTPYRKGGLNITEHVLAGGPHTEIIRLAEHTGADLIVMGAHGAAGEKPALVGSVAEKVMRGAPCSVLTVREPARSAA